MPYKPYAGGMEYKMETITVKPGFKVWVDGGVIEYDLDVCFSKHLNCTETCCLQSYCAETNDMCTVYVTRPKSEVYIGIMVVMMIVAGIPTCIMTVEFVLNYKFCTHKDEQKEAVLGGMTICEALTFVCTCGKSYQSTESINDEYIHEFQEKYKDELSAIEVRNRNTQQGNQIPPLPQTHSTGKLI